MDHASASALPYAHRDALLRAAVRDGTLRDPECALFQALLDDAPEVLASHPLLWDVGWAGGRCDLLFTNLDGALCAVEVKQAPELYGTGRERRNRRDKSRRRWNKLVDQTHVAAHLGATLHRRPVTALGLWREAGAWRIAATSTASAPTPATR